MIYAENLEWHNPCLHGRGAVVWVFHLYKVVYDDRDNTQHTA